MSLLEPILVGGVAAFFLAMGLYALAAPARVLALFDVAVTSAAGRSEVRAVYGGFGVAVAALLAWSIAAPGELAAGARIAVAVALCGMAGGRVVSALFDGVGRSRPAWAFFAIELALAAALFGAG